MFPVAALILGLLGSLHCAGMCGPLVLAMPLNRKNSATAAAGLTVYNLGKALSYALIGAVSGAAGSAVKWAVGQQVLSVAAGTFILLVLLAGLFGTRVKLPRQVEKVFSFVRNSIGKLFRQKGTRANFLIGAMNGFLPCGLVYAAVAGAAASGSWWNGAVFMFVFGIGTMPALFALGLAGSKLTFSFREKLRRVVPVFVAVMAMLLILRGLGLGIPLVSPSLHEGKVVCPHCQHRQK
ncbi:MAG TPA: sulfite exporter TauE/SafE family protein [Bacteroidia bacterium]|nr:sulfite exporter TauE/SafE family protein [Bacteroidia bacterium]